MGQAAGPQQIDVENQVEEEDESGRDVVGDASQLLDVDHDKVQIDGKDQRNDEAGYHFPNSSIGEVVH